MKIDKFNKIGDTSYRVGKQIQGYALILEFLESFIKKDEEEIELDSNYLNCEFIEYCKNENIYSYQKEGDIDRFQLASKLLFQINLLKEIDDKVILSKEIFNQFYKEQPENFFFNKFINWFDFFNKAMEFISKQKDESIDATDLIIAMLIHDNHEDDFEKLFEYVSRTKENDYDDLFLKLSLKSLGLKDLNQINISVDQFYKYRKPPKGKKENKQKLIKFLSAKKENNFISEDDYYFWNNWVAFKDMHKANYFGTYQVNGRKKYEKEYLEYIKNVSYEKLIIDLTKIRFRKLILREYYDLNKRWLNEFNLITDTNKINCQMILLKNDSKLQLNTSQIRHNKYPFDLKDVQEYLIKINEKDFSFKKLNDNIKDITNSTIAEYFVNLFYAMKLNIEPNDFKKYSRTILQTGTLYPQIHAPGHGPDLFHIIQNKLRIVETTIHENKSSVRNNEVFSVVDHVDLDKIKYLKNEQKAKIKETEIILVSLLKKQEQLDEIRKLINSMLNKNQFHKSTDVTNFDKFTKKDWKE